MKCFYTTTPVLVVIFVTMFLKECKILKCPFSFGERLNITFSIIMVLSLFHYVLFKALNIYNSNTDYMKQSIDRNSD